MSLTEWARQFAALEPADSEWDWRDRRVEFSDRIAALAADASSLGLTEAQWDRIAATASRTSVNVLWDDEEDPEFKLQLVERLASLVVKAARLTPTKHFGTRMFWEVIAIQARPIDPAALPRLAVHLHYQSTDIAEALYQAMASQLRSPDKQLQLSALQGLSRLGDPRTPALVQSAQQDPIDNEVRSIAERAARFELV